MALVKRGKYWYGDNQAEIPAELLRYSQLNGDIDRANAAAAGWDIEGGDQAVGSIWNRLCQQWVGVRMTAGLSKELAVEIQQWMRENGPNQQWTFNPLNQGASITAATAPSFRLEFGFLDLVEGELLGNRAA
jgi:hypothetical protein